MNRLIHAVGLLLALASAAVGGQSTATFPGSVIDDGNVRIAPLPGTPEASPQGALDMASLSGTVGPGDFLLLSAQSNRFGPFPYRQDAVIGSERFPYTLLIDSDTEFRLTDPRKHTTMGPFRYETGTPIAFDQSTLSVLRQPAQVIVTVAPRGKQNSDPTLAIAPLTRDILPALNQLRTSLATIFNRRSGELATRSIDGVPTVRDTYGSTYDGLVKPSMRDRENARRRAETAASLLLEKFQQGRMPIKADVAGNLTYRFANLAPGNYVLCAYWRIQERDALSVAPATVEVWWTPFQIGAQKKLVLSLNAMNACGWAGIFKFPTFE